jgi:tryptophan synthase alpha chain
MNPVDSLFQKLREQKRKAFIPFVAAGDPDLRATEMFVQALAENGASLIELGFPYSDPIADGAVIQAAYTRALDHGIKIDDIFATAAKLAASPALASRGIPLVAMASYSLVHHRGVADFIARAQGSGIVGAIVPDLPVDESAALLEQATKRDFSLVHLVTPTTPRDRAVRIAKATTGFLYCVSVTGITGERDGIPPELLDNLRWLKQQTSLPLCVGFGISKPEHVRTLRDVADGVIVGSAFVRRIEQAGKKPMHEVVADVGALAKSLSDALHD